MPYTNRIRKAFTLIELLVVLTIIAVLLAAISYSFTNAQIKGRDGRRKAEIKSVQQTLELYFSRVGKYPDSNAGRIRCNVGGDNSIKVWGEPFVCNSIIYLPKLPEDPTVGQDYYYTGTDFTYQLEAILENDNDSDIGSKPPLCTFTIIPPPTYNFCVGNP